MLNSETKRKIDSARNILVGNVTNPISQVDQITNALIYKFMDDMDQENLDVDLKPQFFVGDYAKYSWTKLLDKKLSGQERFNLYEEGIKKLTYASHIPELFRNIFKNARVPYNDPRVLTLFLKEIDGFSYSHSEELGDAFEYLLSILGSQGDAGQFRTPRHIIDFITEVVDPKKNETILDPACGTAGFLISAYKHILKAHDGLDNKTGKPTNKEKNLTPDEKTKLMNNIVGYDVSPDMVKLSLVNMYLHGFQSPHIHKYNTLTDEKRWDETFDVIMANPPFMTPKGGVETHKRFSIQANRSEVLFVDYIMEHLSIKGRAGIIVPEGIIFKGDKAYKALRKKLVEDGLFAVVSLPAGVFKPYSGVKTSILLFDNQVAKQTDEMLFVKIENDGFDLGAQRRKIDKNDLPKALKILEAWKKGKKQKDEKALWVKKEKIAENGDYNLTGERYREVEEYKNVKWEMVELGKACEIYNGSTPLRGNKGYWDNGSISWFTIEDMRRQGRVIRETKQKITQKALKETSVKLLPPKTVLLCCTASVGEYAITEIATTTNQQFNGLVIKKEYKEKLNPYFLFQLSRNFKNELIRLSGKTSFNFIPVGRLKKIKIPLPPLAVQKEIVEQIEIKQNAINHAREIIKNLERERRYFGQELRKLEKIKIESVKSGLIRALKKLKEKDLYLLNIDVNERTITARLSMYLQQEFLSWNVDHEYNRDISNQKKINGNLIYPDIIIHDRNTDNNLAVIEVKKINDGETDKEKLKNIVEKYGYQNAFFINIDINKDIHDWIETIKEEEADKNWNIEWVELGEVLKYEQPTKYIVGSVDYDNSFKTPVLTAGKTFLLGYTDEEEGIMPVDKLPVIIFDDFTTAIKFVNFPFKVKSSAMKILHTDIKRADPKYLFEVMKTIKFIHDDHKRYWISEFSKIKIPLPSLEIQKQLVAEVEKEEAIITANKNLIETMEKKIEKVISEI